MKIIAKTGSGYLLEADKGEVALLLGFRSTQSVSEDALTIGTEMALNKMARTSEFLRTLDEKRIQELKKNFSSIIDMLNESSQTVHALTVFEELKDA
ncbi:MAG TPA: hypothetical protein VFM18_17975 [Methanosarcina sp.]|nr:hypothetical protein [Methanosarcina sp.]